MHYRKEHKRSRHDFTEKLKIICDSYKNKCITARNIKEADMTSQKN